ncbi:MAG: ABC transporter ATP-binding protein [Halodesulfurarchaeum sp.]|nr:ABC transporter ATP-binding protein [Halodesulfurarchaeum sp.]
MAGSGSAAVIRTDALRKEYGSSVAVDDVSLEIHDGEIFGLLGPNGAGKTTFVEILQGLRRPTAGSATVLDIPIQDGLETIKDRIGVVPQSFHTFERLTVRENVALVRDLHSDPLAVEDVLAELALDEYADERFHSLSGGYQRRTGIAMALVSDPEVLFLDEPTTGLDPSARRTTWEQIEGLPAQGTTVVLTTHYMDEVEYLADRVGLLVDGHIEAVDTVPALIDRYAGTVKIVVHLPADTAQSDHESVESTLESTARTVHEREHGELVGVFEDRQAAQDTYSSLHDLGMGHAIDLVSADMEDVFLELAGKSLTPGGERT